MKLLTPTNNTNFPLTWANLNSYRESKAFRNEIYIIEYSNLLDEMIILFHLLFKDIKESIKIYDKRWWLFTLDTWDISKDVYDYSTNGKSAESQNYLQMLIESEIEIRYTGVCLCNNWDEFLSIILPCIFNHTALYSPIFFSEKYQLFFYFHHTGSIGLYYYENSPTIHHILEIAERHYEIRC